MKHHCNRRNVLRLIEYANDAIRRDDAIGRDHFLDRAIEDAEDGCKICDAADKRRADLQAGIVPPLYIYAVSTSRHYGGPEEGGWYYDRSSVLEVRRAFTPRQTLHAVRSLRADYPTCPRGRHSVIGGSDVEIGLAYTEDMIPADDSAERPRYE